jgi:hypothetical protein
VRRTRRRLAAAVLAGAVALSATACTRQPAHQRDHDSMADMPGMAAPLVYDLSRPFTVPGAAAASPPPAPTSTSTVDGYTVTLSGDPVPGRASPLTVTVRKDGHAVESFNRYLDGYAQLSAFHAGDLARARIGPAGAIGAGGALTAEATFPAAGTWRIVAQFDLAGTVRTAEFTLTVP